MHSSIQTIRGLMTQDTRKFSACRQWRVLAGRLETRNWLVNPGGRALGRAPAWVTVATGVINDVSVEPPFEFVAADASRVHQELRVNLRAQRSTRPLGRAQLKATFFARNTTLASPSAGVCDHYGRS